MFRIINYFIDRNKYIDGEIKQALKNFWFINLELKKEIEELQFVIKQCSEMPLGQELRNKLKYNAKNFSANKTTKICKKVKLSKSEAMNAIVRAFYRRVIKGDKKRQEQRYYYCPDCNAYHLTSKAEK